MEGLESSSSHTDLGSPPPALLQGERFNELRRSGCDAVAANV